MTINPRILLSGASIVAATALGIGATYAYFSDTGTSTNNVFAAGTLDLKLSDDNQTALDSIDTTFNSSTMAPGANPVTATIYLRNTGSIAGNNVYLKAESTITDANPAEDQGAMDKMLEITSATYDGSPIVSLIPDTNGNGIKDLDDLRSVGDGTLIGTLTNLNTNHPLVMTVQLHSSTDNTYQGDSSNTTFTATLTQN